MLARPEYGTHAHILLWLAQQPQRAKFSWHDGMRCAVGQYTAAHNMPNPFVRSFPFAVFETFALFEMNEAAQRLTDADDRVTWGKLRRALEKQWLTGETTARPRAAVFWPDDHKESK